MPGMMRSRKSGCLCLDCCGPRVSDRVSEKRDWQRTEWQQTDPHGYWDDAGCEPSYYLRDDDDFRVGFGGWYSAFQDGELPATSTIGAA